MGEGDLYLKARVIRRPDKGNLEGSLGVEIREVIKKGILKVAEVGHIQFVHEDNLTPINR